MLDTQAKPQRALVIHPAQGRETNSEAVLNLEEAVGLAEALNVDVIDQQSFQIRDIKAAHYLGSGKLDELKSIIKAHDINLVVINAPLAPIQQRNLENYWDAKVVDRTGMILEIFALRAATKEGRLQVELARLGYERSRLVRTWTHLERQRGGSGFLAGPGETQIESDRRQLADKIGKLQTDLDQVRKTRALQRTKRQRAPERVVALVGYTNAGKSTLFNILTESGVFAKDMLFATLDTTHRILTLPSGQNAVMSDTVGFISDLPTDLIDAFRATLEEVKEADLLIHVRDISDPLSENRKQDVLAVLESIEAGPKFDQPIIEVWNKIDLVANDQIPFLIERSEKQNAKGDLARFYPVSCKSGDGIETLREGIEATLSKSDATIDVNIEPKDAQIRAWLHEHGDVLVENISDKGVYEMQVRLPQIDFGILMSRHPQIFKPAT
jgi:GTP-binding protein HflX